MGLHRELRLDSVLTNPYTAEEIERLENFAEEIANETGNHEKAALLAEKSSLAGKSFIKTFMNDAGYLYDYVDGYYKDPNVRPNMIFAVSLPYSPLEKRQKKSVMDFVTK